MAFMISGMARIRTPQFRESHSTDWSNFLERDERENRDETLLIWRSGRFACDMSQTKAFPEPPCSCLPKAAILIVAIFSAFTCAVAVERGENPGALSTHSSQRYLVDAAGDPLLWIGCTPWGMTEWLTRDEVDLYLDDRRSKGMNVVQLCLLWGKRTDEPLDFKLNPSNAYGHRPFQSTDGKVDPSKPAVVSGGGPVAPNDYWDHVEYCLDAIESRGMYAAVLPVWGRRYVNATHAGHSAPIFNRENAVAYGRFLGERFARRRNVIWVMGGDVKADEGGDFLDLYRAMAGALTEQVAKARSAAGQPEFELLMSYHPDGSPMKNSSFWFHEDEWLDFNMIETFSHVDRVAAAVRADVALSPPKPTILAEGDYEGAYEGEIRVDALSVRRQAYQSFFAGAAGFTYGAAFDVEGNGPLFGPSNNWKPLLAMEGAGQMLHLRQFLEGRGWPRWSLALWAVGEGRGEGRLEKLAVEADGDLLVYFPDNTPCGLPHVAPRRIEWFNPMNGRREEGEVSARGRYQPPDGWQDAVLIVKR